jgi:hypothetical protein
MRKLLALVCVCLGCITADGALTPEYVKHLCNAEYPIVVSPDASFSSIELVYLQMGVDRWNTETGVKVFSLSPGYLDENPTVSGIEVNHVTLRGKEVGIWYFVTFPDPPGPAWRSIISLDINEMNTNEIYPSTVVHELGHALTLRHDTYDPGSVMYPLVFTSGQQIRQKHLDRVRELVHSKRCD